MSKQTDAKAAQGYVEEIDPDRCGNCAHFTSEKTTVDHGYGPYTEEKKLRCSVWGFKIKRNGGCKCHKRIERGSK